MSRASESLIAATNGSATFVKGFSNSVITASMLKATDVNDAPANVTFTLTDLPDHGVLRLSGLALSVGATFTQADIDAGRLVYAHGGVGLDADSFTFDLSDPKGAVRTGQSFQIEITQPIWEFNLPPSTLDGANGFQIRGAVARDYAGKAVAAAGDINGDGFADIIVGAPGADPNSSDSGAAYVVFGKASGFPAGLELNSLNGNNGFKINGAAAFDRLEKTASAAGDVNAPCSYLYI